jgi:hypothetical protein
VHQHTAERPPVPDLRVRDGAGGRGDQLRVLGDQRVARHVVVGGHRTDHDRVAVVPDATQLGDLREVDHGRRRGEPQPQHRQQALPPAEHLDITTGITTG